MSVMAEYFKVDIVINDQITLDSLNKSKHEVEKLYLDELKIKSEELIGTIPEKNTNNNFIEIISVDDDSIFGIIGKSNKVEESVMRRVKDQEGESLSSTDFNLEDYRFFVFHMPTLRCGVIKNSTAPAFQRLFNDFLDSCKAITIKTTNVIPIKDENIHKKFNFFKEIVKVDMIFAKNSSLQSQILSPNKMFDISENSLVKSSVSFTLRDQRVSSDLRDFINNNDLIEHEFDKLALTGTDNIEQTETLEFVKKLLTLNVNINIDYDSLKFSESYFEQIKKALLESFHKF